MVSDKPQPIIVAENLRKEYRIHRRQATTLKEMVVRNLMVPVHEEEFIALDGLSFTLEPGSALAIVGGNGSGKSTLLKLITGIIQQSSGTLKVNGRVAALLELGAGFQEEFTGMENVFLQCSIMGLNRQQTLERLPSILTFAEIDDFIHTPVKHYSSGMFIRLAFAVALQVDADILVLDEVMAVGDQSFQEKCKEHIRKLRHEGKTILFVSHSLDQVRLIADKVLWLDHGHMMAMGSAREVLPKYYEYLQKKEISGTSELSSGGDLAPELTKGIFSTPEAAILEARVTNQAGEEARMFRLDDSIHFQVDIQIKQRLSAIKLTIVLGSNLQRAAWTDSGAVLHDAEPGRYRFNLTLSDHHLSPGIYLVAFGLYDPEDDSRRYSMMYRMNALSLYAPDEDVHLDRYTALVTPVGCFTAAQPSSAPLPLQ